MNNVFNYNNFLDNLILEKEEVKLSFKISKKFHELISSIKHPISEKLLESADKEEEKTITMLDIDVDNTSNFIYTPSDKMFKYTEEQENPYNIETKQLFKYSLSNKNTTFNTKYKVTSSIGKVINKLYPNEFKASGDPGNDIESFANEVKLKRNFAFNRFKIVEGNDIIKYYDKSSYDSRCYGSSLGNSCMSSSSKSSYINFYAINPVQLVILMSDKEEDKIIGRALLWKLDDLSIENNITENNLDRYFMDRIYTIYDYDVQLFKEYAAKNGWIHKHYQNMDHDGYFIDTITNEKKHMYLRTLSTFNKNKGGYPYMDTMKWFYVDDGYLMNTEDDNGSTIYFMESTSGGFDVINGDDDDNENNENMVMVDGEWYPREECTYCEMGDEWVLNEDIIFCYYYEECASPRYVSRNMVWSEYEEDYIKHNDSVYCDLIEDYIFDHNAIQVYIDVNKKGVKHIPDDKEYYIEYSSDGNDYDELDEYGEKYYKVLLDKGVFIKVYNSTSEYSTFNYYKKDIDKDKYVYYKGKYYTKKAALEIDQYKLKLEKNKINYEKFKKL